MERLKLKIPETNLFDSVFPYLHGHVFHVTKLRYLDSIIQCGEIRTNKEGNLETTFGSSSNSFFRNRGCVSLFDYRIIDPDIFEKHAYKCTPTKPASLENGIAVLFLSEGLHSKLISWKLWHEEKAYKEMVLPHFETGHPGSINIAGIKKIIEITVTEVPESMYSSFHKAMKNG